MDPCACVCLHLQAGRYVGRDACRSVCTITPIYIQIAAGRPVATQHQHPPHAHLALPRDDVEGPPGQEEVGLLYARRHAVKRLEVPEARGDSEGAGRGAHQERSNCFWQGRCIATKARRLGTIVTHSTSSSALPKTSTLSCTTRVHISIRLLDPPLVPPPPISPPPKPHPHTHPCAPVPLYAIEGRAASGSQALEGELPGGDAVQVGRGGEAHLLQAPVAQGTVPQGASSDKLDACRKG
jgi:hypothetical protein